MGAFHAINAINRPARIQVAEICKRLQLGERAVYGLLEAKMIPAIRIGHRWVIARYAYEEWEKYFGQRNAPAVH
jgi:excisionase family DNA binding protein